MRNQQLKAELAEFQRLKVEEEHLRLEVFKARLSSDNQAILEREARARINRRSPISVERQIEIAREEIVREWFETDSQLAPDEHRCQPRT